MDIFFSSYQLKPRSNLNAKSSAVLRSGALIKVAESDFFGVADLFTWPEFGDDEWQVEIKSNSNLFKRSLELAQHDLEARKEKRSLLKNVAVKNNLLILDFEKEKIENTIVKIKANYDIEKLAQVINTQEAKYRIDFNSILSVDEMDEFLNLLSPKGLKRIEYIEDPTVWNNLDWDRWNKIVPLAIDWSTLDPFAEPSTWSTLVVKPSRQNAEGLLKQAQKLNKKLTVTSSMGHPVGIMHDLSWVQNQLNAEGVHGLMTLNVYEDTPFHKYFLTKESLLQSTSENLKQSGLGMTEALNQLSWKNIREL